MDLTEIKNYIKQDVQFDEDEVYFLRIACLVNSLRARFPQLTFRISDITLSSVWISILCVVHPNPMSKRFFFKNNGEIVVMTKCRAVDNMTYDEYIAMLENLS